MPALNEVSLQDDGNLVLYTRDGRVAWASNTDSPTRDAYTLEVSLKTLCEKHVFIAVSCGQCHQCLAVLESL